MKNLNVLIPSLKRINDVVSQTTAYLGAELQRTNSKIRQEEGFKEIVAYTEKQYPIIEEYVNQYMFTVGLIAPTKHAFDTLRIILTDYIVFYIWNNVVGSINNCKAREDHVQELKDKLENLYHKIVKTRNQILRFMKDLNSPVKVL